MTLARLDMLAGDVLEVLWRASWQAAVLAGMVLLVQWLLRGRLSARWRYNLWLLVLLRLIVPVTPQSSLSVFNLSSRFARPAPTYRAEAHIPSPPVAISHITGPQNLVDRSALVRNATPQDVSRFDPAPSRIVPHAPIPWRLILVCAWLTGALILLARIGYATIRLARAVRRMTRVDDANVLNLLDRCRSDLAIRRRVTVLACNELPAPALMGVLRPRLLLPRHVLDNFAPGELRLILLHELGHLKRNDVLINWIVSLLQVLHWFNPMLFFAFARLRADRELATDELVLSRTGDTEKFAYGDTIVKLLQSLSHAHRPAPAPLVGAVGILERAHLLRRRITMIAQFRHHARHWTAVAAVCMLALAGFGLTDAVRGDDAPTPAQSAQPVKPSAQPTASKRVESAAVAAAAGAQPATTQPGSNNERLNAIIDDVMAKMMARTPKPGRADFDAAMKEVAKRVREQGLVFNQNGQPINEAQINKDLGRVQQLMDGKVNLTSAAAGPATTTADSRGLSAATAAAQRKLAQLAPEINFSALPFSDAVDFFRDTTELNLFVNWRAIEGAGVGRNAPINVRLKNVPFEQALRYVLRDAGAGTVALDFAVVDGIVNITTADELATDVKVRVYNVARLLKQMPSTMPANDSEEIIRANKAEHLVQIICETVAPDSWRSAGGAVGSISEINGRLVVGQTEANHALIAKLLEEISEQDEVAATAPRGGK